MTGPTSLPGGAVLRPLDVGDAPALFDAFIRNRDHLRPFEPVRPASFWTLAGQRDRLVAMARRREEGTSLAWAMFRDGRLLGCATFNEILRGPSCSTRLGYWVDAAEVGQGLASVAVATLCRVADEELGLHRIEASTNTTNVASARVLAKNGFEQFGMARDYLHIDGSWKDSCLFQRILNDRAPSHS